MYERKFCFRGRVNFFHVLACYLYTYNSLQTKKIIIIKLSSRWVFGAWGPTTPCKWSAQIRPNDLIPFLSFFSSPNQNAAHDIKGWCEMRRFANEKEKKNLLETGWTGVLSRKPHHRFLRWKSAVWYAGPTFPTRGTALRVLLRYAWLMYTFWGILTMFQPCKFIEIDW